MVSLRTWYLVLRGTGMDELLAGHVDLWTVHQTARQTELIVPGAIVEGGLTCLSPLQCGAPKQI